MVEVVRNRSVDGGELLKTSHSPEAKHSSFPPSKWQMRILRTIVQPAARFLPASCTDLLQRRSIRTQTVGDYHFRPAMLAHCFLLEFQGGLLVSALVTKRSKNSPS